MAIRRRKKPEREPEAAAPVMDQPPPAPGMVYYPDDNSGVENLGQLDITIAGKRFSVDFHGPNRGIYRSTGMESASFSGSGQININDRRAVTRISIPSSRAEDDLITAAANLASKARFGNATPEQTARLGAIMLAIDSGQISAADVARLLPQGRSYEGVDAPSAPVAPKPVQPAASPLLTENIGRLF